MLVSLASSCFRAPASPKTFDGHGHVQRPQLLVEQARTAALYDKAKAVLQVAPGL